MSIMFNNSWLVQEKALQNLWKKQQVTMQNIANVDTPNYKAKYVTFEEELKASLDKVKGQKTSKIREELQKVQSNVKENTNVSARADGNNVSMDVEQVELARSTLQYQYLLDSVNKDISRVRSVIKGQ